MLGTSLMALLMLGGEPEPRGLPPSGALLGWTSNDAVVVEARGLVAKGRWSDAEKLLQEAPGGGPESVQARSEMLEIIRRLRIDYAVEESALLAKIHKDLPGVTGGDLKRWREAGQVRFRMVDGQVRYFRSEPRNLFRFCPEARRRLSEHAPQALPTAGDKEKRLERAAHLKAVIAAAERTGKTEVLPVRHRVRFTLTVAPNRPGARAGSVIRCWLPFPQVYRQQKDVKLLRTSPAEHVIAPNALGETADPESIIQSPRSDFPGAAQRTVYFEQKIEDPGKPIVFEEEFEYTSYAYYPVLRDEEVRPLPAGFDPVYLAERPPHIVFTPQIKALAQKIVGNETNPLAKARKIFHYLDQTVLWGPEEEYSIIPSFCMQALTRKQGDCGLQAALFMTLCRYVGVPTRWQSGYQTQPWSPNMHDWAEMYIEPWGWLPVDVSYGLQEGDDPKVRAFYLGHQDSYRLIVNLDYGRPLFPPKAAPRSEPADFQRGEVEIDGRNLYYDEWDSDYKIEWRPG